MPKSSNIIPCYNNEHNIQITGEDLIQNESNFTKEVSFHYALVDDASFDNNWEKLKKLKQKYHEKDNSVKLARNIGSYNVILSGINNTKEKVKTVIVSDLQDSPELLVNLYEHWKNGLLWPIDMIKMKSLDKNFYQTYITI